MVTLLSRVLAEEAVPKLGFAWRHDLTYTQMVKESTVIVIGEVRSAAFVGSSVHATDDRGNTGEWQLMKVETTVENVLKGAARQRAVSFYFYTWLGGTSGDWNALKPRSRYVFFLVRDYGVLRAVRDFWRSSVEVGSGRHRTLPLDNLSPIQERIGTLLLTLGEDPDPSQFRRSLPRAVSLAEEWLGPCRTGKLLKALLNSPDVRTAAAAQDQLRTRPEVSNGCTDSHAGNRR